MKVIVEGLQKNIIQIVVIAVGLIVSYSSLSERVRILEEKQISSVKAMEEYDGGLDRLLIIVEKMSVSVENTQEDVKEIKEDIKNITK